MLKTETNWIAVLGLFLISAACALASEVKLAWDASTTPGVSYILCAHTQTVSLGSALVRLDTGTNTTVTLSNLVAGRWQFACFAEKNGFYSDRSNVIIGEVPPPPPNLRVIVPQWSATIVSTGWQDVGFFKVRIERP